jgi:biopolymer transport protein ExbD
MVDVVMVILIFFMLGTSFALSEGVLPSQLPAQVGPGGAASVSIVPQVRIALVTREASAACRILVMGKELSEEGFEALYAFLLQKVEAGADPAGRVLLAVDPVIRYEDVVYAMDACVRAGMPNVQLVVGPGEIAAARQP